MAVRGQEGQTTEVDVARAAAGSTNVAVMQDRYGSAAVLRLATIARPEVADHEVLIRVQAAGLDRGVGHLLAGQPIFKLDLVHPLGADHVVDYPRQDFADGAHRYNLIIDAGGNPALSRLRDALTSPGTAVWTVSRRP